jgi:pimeloyl-ACP methyl ester carboxylesterase
MLNRSRRNPARCIAASLVLGCLLSACGYAPKPTGPIPVKTLPAPQPGADRPLVIVLPGRGDDLHDLEQVGIAEAVQRAWPTADVLLAGATLGYYQNGNIAVLLHDQVIAPARQRGYKVIWLTGASMGGMGALLYERSYPHDVTGLVLMAPYMGDPGLTKTVSDAGGPAAWDPGPTPAQLGPDNYQRELWRVVKSWNDSPAEGARIWLVCGDEDRFIEVARLMAPLLPTGHFIQGHGGHEWPVWDAGAEQAFNHIGTMH